MQLKDCKWIVLLMVLHVTSAIQSQYFEDNDYFYSEPEMEDYDINYDANVNQVPQQFYRSLFPRSLTPMTDAQLEMALEATTECEPEKSTTVAPTTAKPKGTTDDCVGGDSNKEAAVTTIAPPEASTTSVSTTEATPEPTMSLTEAPAPTGAPTTAAAHVATTTSAPSPAMTHSSAPAPAPASSPVSVSASAEVDDKTKELQQLVQHLYIAQARVQLEATEIKKAQAVANSAQQGLEEAANHVRTLTATLQNAQQEVASAAIRAQTAQLQLAAHDQLLFAARQDVDALSSQMVGIQAAEGFAQPKVQFDLGGLLDRLKQPLQDNEKPTAIPPLVPPPLKDHRDRIDYFPYLNYE